MAKSKYFLSLNFLKNQAATQAEGIHTSRMKNLIEKESPEEVKRAREA